MNAGISWEWFDEMRPDKYRGYLGNAGFEQVFGFKDTCWHKPTCSLDCGDHRDLADSYTRALSEVEIWKDLAANAGRKTGDKVVKKLGQMALFTDVVGHQSARATFYGVLHAGIEMQTRTLTRRMAEAQKRLAKFHYACATTPGKPENWGSVIVGVENLLAAHVDEHFNSICPSCRGMGILQRDPYAEGDE